MKKWMALLLALLTLASLTACGGGGEENNGPQNATEITDPAEEQDKNADTDREETERPAEDPRLPGAAVVEPSEKESAGTIEEAGEGTVEIKGGTNQNDAVLVPLDTKMYGTVRDGRYAWFAFTTRETADAVYKLTAINKTLDASRVVFKVYDEDGGELADLRADQSGAAFTKAVKGLAPNTTYYITASCEYERKETIDSVLTVKSPQGAGGYQTTDSLQSAGGTTGADILYPGGNMDDAPLFPLDAKVSGQAADGRRSWFAFATGAAENAAYKFTAVNETLDASRVVIKIYDEERTELADLRADSSGRAASKEVEGLLPQTVYYMAIFCEYERDETIDYTLTIKSPEEAAPAGATVEAPEETLVFTVPFELNSTQVMFVADQAVFVSEADAKAALAPVAEIILAHPDHPILIAGTTATSGEQASCVRLSNRRAEAVKNMLTETFGVPASQLLTIGLGYEADPFARGQDRDASGKFVESEWAKNRRVIILDAEDPIARELLDT